jgi:hypothetical protein
LWSEYHQASLSEILIFLASTLVRPIRWVLGAKRPQREADNSPPSSAYIKNGGALFPLVRMFSWRSILLLKHRDNFTLTVPCHQFYQFYSRK